MNNEINKLIDLKVSHSGRYILGNNMMYDVLLDESVSIDSLHPLFWLNFLKENSEISYKYNRYDEFDSQTLLRKTAYVLSETFDETERMNILMEYERKYGSALLLESSNKYSFEKTLSEGWNFLIESVLKNTYGIIDENWFGDAVDWVGDKAKKVAGAVGDASNWVGNKIVQGAQWVGDKLTQAWNWVKEKGVKFFMEGIREAVLSPVGMAVEIFLTTTGIGAPVVMIIYGFLLIYDIYLWFSGSSDFNWINLVFDLLGIFTSGVAVAPFRLAAKEAGILAKTAGKSVEEGVSVAVKKGGKLGSFLRDVVTYISKGFGTILGWIKKGTSWISKNFGIKFLDNWVGKAQGAVQKFAASMEKAGVKAAETTTAKVATTGAETVAKKPGIISRVMEPLNKVGRALDKPIEKLLPGTTKRFEKDVFGNVIKHPGKISTGLRNATIFGGAGAYLHNRAENKKEESEKEMAATLQQSVEKMRGATVPDDII